MEQTTRLEISGMHCAACAAALEKALSRVPGVAEAAVNFATEMATVRHDPARARLEALLHAVEAAGYQARPAGGGDRTAEAEREARYQRNLFLLGALCSIPLMVLGMGHHPLAPRWVLLLLATPVQMLVGWQYLRNSWAALRTLSPNMDVLIALGSGTAYLYSTVVVLLGHDEHVYFETSAMILTLVTLGRWMEKRARGAASRAMRALLDLTPPRARVLRDGQEAEIDAAELQVGDRFVVRPGEQIATDGVLESGEGAVDESMVTGESLPRHRQPGDEVVGGTLNQEGLLTVRATRVGAETVLRRIVALVEETQGAKAPIQRLADTVAGYFVPVVLLLAVGTFVGWYLHDPSNWQTVALVNAVAVLVIACPCALGLATPTAVMVGSGLGARHGILLRDAAALERAGRLTTVLWDKTGTLTSGQVRVAVVHALSGTEADLLRLAAAAESGSEHPLARAIVAEAERRGLEPPPLEAFAAVVGRGVQAQIEAAAVLVGSPGLMREQGVATDALEQEIALAQGRGETVALMAREGQLLGLIGLADDPKPGAREAVAQLSGLGLRQALLTGDHPRTAEALARELGLNEVHAELLPADKVRLVRELQAAGQVVAMVGDGINDAPALAQADLGIALGTGTDVAQEAGQVTLVSGEPAGVVRALLLSRAMLRHIQQNLFWAFFYNVVAIPLAVAGRLDPMIAAAAMAGSSLFVVGNSLRLLQVKL